MLPCLEYTQLAKKKGFGNSLLLSYHCLAAGHWIESAVSCSCSCSCFCLHAAVSPCGLAIFAQLILLEDEGEEGGVRIEGERFRDADKILFLSFSLSLKTIERGYLKLPYFQCPVSSFPTYTISHFFFVSIGCYNGLSESQVQSPCKNEHRLPPSPPSRSTLTSCLQDVPIKMTINEVSKYPINLHFYNFPYVF